MAARPNLERDLLPRSKQARVETDILVDLDRSIAAIPRDDELETAPLLGLGKKLLVITRLGPLRAWLDPDLKKMRGFGLRSVVLAVRDAASGRQALHLAGLDGRPVAHAVFVRERALE